jgi:hypothetical protein
MLSCQESDEKSILCSLNINNEPIEFKIENIRNDTILFFDYVNKVFIDGNFIKGVDLSNHISMKNKIVIFYKHTINIGSFLYIHETGQRQYSIPLVESNKKTGVEIIKSMEFYYNWAESEDGCRIIGDTILSDLAISQNNHHDCVLIYILLSEPSSSFCYMEKKKILESININLK